MPDAALRGRMAAGRRLALLPSGWLLADKFDRPMADIHAPVPGYAGAMAERVHRIFDHLQPQIPVWRLNWSIYGDGALRHARAHDEIPAAHTGNAAHVHTPESASQCYLRMERQTLTKMPVSGDILFTIRIYSDPLAALRARPDLARALHAQLLAMSDAQLAYKGLRTDRDALATALADLRASGQTGRSSAITLPSLGRLPGAANTTAPLSLVTATADSAMARESESDGAAVSACSVITSCSFARDTTRRSRPISG